MSPTSGYQTAGSGAKPHTGKKVSRSATSQGSMEALHHAASYPGEAVYGHHGGYSAEPGSRRLPVLPEERKPEEDPYHLTEPILSLREEIDCLGQQLHATQIGVTTREQSFQHQESVLQGEVQDAYGAANLASLRLAEVTSAAGAEVNAQITAEMSQIKTAEKILFQRLSSVESSLMAEITARDDHIRALSAHRDS